MAKKVNDDLIEKRRARVGYWRLRGKTQREVVRLLGEEGFVNPETGEPYGLTAVNDDCKALRRLWKQEQAGAIGVIKGVVLAELREVRSSAWEGAAPRAVIEALTKSLLEDKDSGVRIEAAKALGRLGGVDYGAILGSLKQESALFGLDAPIATKGDLTVRVVYADS